MMILLSKRYLLVFKTISHRMRKARQPLPKPKKRSKNKPRRRTSNQRK